MKNTVLFTLNRIVVAWMVSATAVAAPVSTAFVAPGLWRIVADIQGPMGQRQRMTQDQCWDEHGGSGQATGFAGASGVATSSYQVDNAKNRSTIHIHCVINTSADRITQNIDMVFAIDPANPHRAIMTGHGSMTYSGTPILNETYSQTGYRLSATCPATLPPAKTENLQNPVIPGMAATGHH